MGHGMKRAQLRALPAVEKVLQALGDLDLPRPLVVDIVRQEIGALRKRKAASGFDDLLAAVRAATDGLRASRIQPVINATGVLVHTNFGRAPLGSDVIAALSAIGASYNNLEYGLTDGTRGGRGAYVEHGLALLCSAEASTIVNNNAAALVLILRHFCESDRVPAGGRPPGPAGRTHQKNEVVISRGELVQIGGGFRIPDILESSGARLREVGTTNKTSLGDYARAIGPETALILTVHRSNFFMDGFVESPTTRELAALARRKRITLVEDLGSGAMVKTDTIAGLEHEPTPAEALRHGVDLVCFSGDKLLGGPQAGIVAGRAKLVAALKREPLFRALRCDKLILTALQTTVDAYLRELPGSGSHRPSCGIPVLDMLRATEHDLRIRAEIIVTRLAGLPMVARVGAGRGRIGGGALPRSTIASVTVDLSQHGLDPQDLARRLRAHTVPVIGYIARGKLRLDLRTVFPRQDDALVNAIRTVSAA
jgi:L-seryl-tRNA(Ser) seleniumtransferase